MFVMHVEYVLLHVMGVSMHVYVLISGHMTSDQSDCSKSVQ